MSTPPSQTPPPTITANTPPNTQEPKKDLPPPTQQPPRDTPTVSPQPPKNDDMNRAPHQDRTTQPQAPKENHDMSRSTEPSHDGASTRDNHDQKPMLPSPHDGSAMNQPPKDNHDMSKPPHEGISQAVEKLSPADREELMKLIRSFLESKGIQVTLPAQSTPGTNPSTEPVRPTPNTNTITEPTTPTITNPDYQKKSQTRRDKSKRRVTQSTSSSGSFSIDTK